jgi:nucleotide-binding universal stress UspA family protein
MPTRVVLGLDGSHHARRAEAFLARLRPAGRVQIVRVVEPVGPVTTGLLPASVRNRILSEAGRLEAARRRVAQRDVDAAAQRLRRAGWRATAEVRRGVPLEELMKSVRAAHANMLVVGARGVGGAVRLLLGSVADGALRHAPCAVLVIR